MIEVDCGGVQAYHFQELLCSDHGTQRMRAGRPDPDFKQFQCTDKHMPWFWLPIFNLSVSRNYAIKNPLFLESILISIVLQWTLFVRQFTTFLRIHL